MKKVDFKKSMNPPSRVCDVLYKDILRSRTIEASKFNGSLGSFSGGSSGIFSNRTYKIAMGGYYAIGI